MSNILLLFPFQRLAPDIQNHYQQMDTLFQHPVYSLLCHEDTLYERKRMNSVYLVLYDGFQYKEIEYQVFKI